MFIIFDDRPSDSPFVERVWRCHSERAGAFLSVASIHWEIVVTRLAGATMLTVRGPETRSTELHCPADVADTVHFAGDYDQAHLTRTLKRLIGLTPAKIVSEERQLVVSIQYERGAMSLDSPLLEKHHASRALPIFRRPLRRGRRALPPRARRRSHRARALQGQSRHAGAGGRGRQSHAREPALRGDARARVRRTIPGRAEFPGFLALADEGRCRWPALRKAPCPAELRASAMSFQHVSRE